MESLIKLFCLFACFITIAFSACPDQWSHFQDKCFFLSRENETFGEALTICEMIGRQYGRSASLATVDDAQTQSFLVGMIKKTDYEEVYIGLNDIVKEGEFVWAANGRKATYFAWGPTQPNNRFGAENCAAITYDPPNQFTYLWTDDPCTVKKYFLCEMVAADISNTLG